MDVHFSPSPLYDPTVLEYGDLIIDKVKGHTYRFLGERIGEENRHYFRVEFVQNNRLQNLRPAPFKYETLRDPDRFNYVALIHIPEGSGRWQDYPEDPYYEDPD